MIISQEFKLKSKSSDSYKCSLCKSLFDDPVDHICGNTFCSKCVKLIPNCPMCKVAFDTSSLKISSTSIRQALCKVKLICNRCSEIVLYQNLIKHYESICEIDCSHECGTKITRDKAREHFILCPNYVKRCPGEKLGCFFEGSGSSYVNHIKTCSYEFIRPLYDAMLDKLRYFEDISGQNTEKICVSLDNTLQSYYKLIADLQDKLNSTNNKDEFYSNELIDKVQNQIKPKDELVATLETFITIMNELVTNTEKIGKNLDKFNQIDTSIRKLTDLMVIENKTIENKTIENDQSQHEMQNSIVEQQIQTQTTYLPDIKINTENEQLISTQSNNIIETLSKQEIQKETITFFLEHLATDVICANCNKRTYQQYTVTKSKDKPKGKEQPYSYLIFCNVCTVKNKLPSSVELYIVIK